MKTLVWLLLLTGAAVAQQQGVPLTDWRARLDVDLSKLSMPRDSHVAIVNLLQFYEREAHQQKAPLKPEEPAK